METSRIGGTAGWSGPAFGAGIPAALALLALVAVLAGAQARAELLAPPDSPPASGEVVEGDEVDVTTKLIKPELTIFTVLKEINYEPPPFVRSFLKGINESVKSPSLDSPKE